MVRVLELFDESGPSPVSTGSTAELESGGKVVYKGSGVQSIIGRWLRDHSATDVFDTFDGWSNGYASLKERKR